VAYQLPLHELDGIPDPDPHEPPAPLHLVLPRIAGGVPHRDHPDRREGLLPEFVGVPERDVPEEPVPLPVEDRVDGLGDAEGGVVPDLDVGPE